MFRLSGYRQNLFLSACGITKRSNLLHLSIRCTLILLFLMNTLSSVASAEKNKYAVIYPDIREPYRQIFINIADGIKENIEGDTLYYSVPKNQTPELTSEWLRKNNISGMVVLGKRNVRELDGIAEEITSVFGAATVLPGENSISGISHAPSPGQLFSQLKQMKPNIKNIYVINLSEYSKWITDIAKTEAQALELNYHVTNAENITQLAKAYRKLLNTLDAKQDALWLVQSGGEIGRTLVNEILQKAWDKKLTVFSNNLADVKRGVLFTLYPDNQNMGGNLGNLLMDRMNNPHKENTVELVKALSIAINVRTAEHLGLHYSKKELKEFEFVYPPR